MQTTMQNPEKLQNAMKRIIKRLQEKFQRGEFRPQDLVAEAEEMMKEFADNPEFVGMMESMRSTFGFEDMDLARASGREGSARLSMVQQRLRREHARRSTPATSASVMSSAEREMAEAAARAIGESLLREEEAEKSKGKKRR